MSPNVNDAMRPLLTDPQAASPMATEFWMHLKDATISPPLREPTTEELRSLPDSDQQHPLTTQFCLAKFPVAGDVQLSQAAQACTTAVAITPTPPCYVSVAHGTDSLGRHDWCRGWLRRSQYNTIYSLIMWRVRQQERKTGGRHPAHFVVESTRGMGNTIALIDMAQRVCKEGKSAIVYHDKDGIMLMHPSGAITRDATEIQAALCRFGTWYFVDSSDPWCATATTIVAVAPGMSSRCIKSFRKDAITLWLGSWSEGELVLGGGITKALLTEPRTIDRILQLSQQRGGSPQWVLERYTHPAWASHFFNERGKLNLKEVDDIRSSFANKPELHIAFHYSVEFNPQRPTLIWSCKTVAVHVLNKASVPELSAFYWRHEGRLMFDPLLGLVTEHFIKSDWQDRTSFTCRELAAWLPGADRTPASAAASPTSTFTWQKSLLGQQQHIALEPHDIRDNVVPCIWWLHIRGCNTATCVVMRVPESDPSAATENWLVQVTAQGDHPVSFEHLQKLMEVTGSKTLVWSVPSRQFESLQPQKFIHRSQHVQPPQGLKQYVVEVDISGAHYRYTRAMQPQQELLSTYQLQLQSPANTPAQIPAHQELSAPGGPCEMVVPLQLSPQGLLQAVIPVQSPTGERLEMIIPMQATLNGPLQPIISVQSDPAGSPHAIFPVQPPTGRPLQVASPGPHLQIQSPRGPLLQTAAARQMLQPHVAGTQVVARAAPRDVAEQPPADRPASAEAGRRRTLDDQLPQQPLLKRPATIHRSSRLLKLGKSLAADDSVKLEDEQQGEGGRRGSRRLTK